SGSRKLRRGTGRSLGRVLRKRHEPLDAGLPEIHHLVGGNALDVAAAQALGEVVGLRRLADKREHLASGNGRRFQDFLLFIHSDPISPGPGDRLVRFHQRLEIDLILELLHKHPPLSPIGGLVLYAKYAASAAMSTQSAKKGLPAAKVESHVPSPGNNRQ